MDVLIFDYEVFKYDTLLGVTNIRNKSRSFIWGTDKIKEYFLNNQSSLWVGFNNLYYDNLVMEAVAKDKDVFQTSYDIVNSKIKKKSDFIKYTYDILDAQLESFSLKQTELLVGKKVHTSEIDFNIDRPLTDEEKKIVENYNNDDLEQTEFLFNYFKSDFVLRVDIAKEFKLPLNEVLTASISTIASKVLKPKKKAYFERLEQKLPNTLDLKDEDLKSFFYSEDYKSGKVITKKLCDVEITIAGGGLHSKKKKYSTKKSLHFDVSGYYNLLMILYDLFPRTMSEESKQIYKTMYEEQLKMKVTNPKKREVYKKVLLAVWGSTKNKYTDFYDPEKGDLITIIGEFFLYELLEKLDGLGIAFNVNTDGVYFDPYDWKDEDKIVSIINEWTSRTGFTLKIDKVYDLWQRDVNCYLYKDKDGCVHTVGDIIKNFDEKMPLNAKEPLIISKGIVNALVYGTEPEVTVESNKHDLTQFQYCCKKGAFQKLVYKSSFKDTSRFEEPTKNPSRVFALKSNDWIGMVYKVGNGKTVKYGSLPDNVFINNDDIRDKKVYNKIVGNIDFDYYIERIYQKLSSFVLEEETDDGDNRQNLFDL